MTGSNGAPAGDIAARLRAPFKPAEIGKLPRVTCGDCSDKRKTCGTHQKSRCDTCKAWVSTAHIHLDYVGHADVTSRLLEVDPEWNWEPVATDEHGLPMFDTDSQDNPVGLWIRLTVGGVTRLGYGSCPSGQNDAVKVLIGDALRNSALRFGVALDLWAKGDRSDPAAENATAAGGQAQRRRPPQSQREESRPAEPSADVDDGEWGDWRTRIDAIASQQDADKLDAELRGAFKTGRVGPAKANNIRQAIKDKGASLGKDDTPEYDMVAQKLAGNAEAAADTTALRKVHQAAKTAGKLPVFVKLEEGFEGSLLSYITARKAELEQDAAKNGQPAGVPA